MANFDPVGYGVDAGFHIAYAPNFGTGDVGVTVNAFEVLSLIVNVTLFSSYTLKPVQACAVQDFVESLIVPATVLVAFPRSRLT